MRLRLSLFVLLALLPACVRASDAAVQVFETDVFAEAAPDNALDMVKRLPGFAIVDADADVRGYAGAQGNVLVDGARPASKREGVETVLERIPARAVARIELIRGGAGGVEMFGHALVANVVRKATAVTERAVEVGSLLAADGWLAQQAQFDVARQWNDRAFEFSLASTPELDEDTGRGRILAVTPGGDVREDSRTDIERDRRLRQLDTHWRQPLGGGRLTLFSALRDTRENESGVIDTLLPQPALEIHDASETFREAEFGARYTQALTADTQLDVVASQQLGWLDALSHAQAADERERFEQRTRSGEGIGRIDLRHERDPRLTLNAGIEVARNGLDGDAMLVENGEVIALPGSRVAIGERRAEAAIGANWRVTEAWRIESGLRFERSRLAQRGDGVLSRDFTALKPRLGVTWARSPREQWRFVLAREVGQLDFEDFVASAALDTGIVTAGNVDLRPDSTWRASLAWEHTFGNDGAVVLTWHRDRIDDVIDRVPVFADDDVFDAPGNIGGGRRDSLVLDLGTSLDRIGLPNVRFASAIVWQHSRVRDPTTGESRGISEEKPLEGELSLIHTLVEKRLSWGIDIDLAERETDYRFDEVQTERVAAAWTLFAERGFGSAWRWRAELSDLGGRSIRKTRERHDGVRTRDPVDELERRTHRTPGQLLLILRREMGG